MEANYKFNRIMSSLIDGFVMLVLLILICIVPTINVISNSINGHFILSDVLWLSFSVFGTFCLWILYLFLTSLVFKNATLGMKINKLVFVSTNGNPMNFKTLLFRETAVVVCLVFSLGFAAIIEPFSLICSENGRNFYDIFSSTKVVTIDVLD